VTQHEIYTFPVGMRIYDEDGVLQDPLTSGGGGGGATRVYQHVCDGVEDHLALPAPASANMRRTVLVQLLDPDPNTISLIIGKDDGNSPNVRSVFDPGSVWNVVIEILFAGSSHPSAYFHQVGVGGGGDAAGFNGGMGWRGSGGTPDGAVPEWTLRCALNPDASGPTPFPAGSTVEVWDQ
jgi:hypothetical protein